MDSFYLTVRWFGSGACTSITSCATYTASWTTLKGREDPLDAVARRVAKRYRLICFDEFDVYDVADAMILGRLLQRTMDRGVVYCMTSNYPPDELYKDGLKREHFLPTIELIKSGWTSCTSTARSTTAGARWSGSRSITHRSDPRPRTR